MITFIMNLACVMLNSFAAGWCFMEGDVGWGIANICIAAVNGVAVILNDFKARVN